MEKQKTYIAIDLKSFYASVECVDRALDPLTTNLLVADVSKTEKTICLAVTPSLKAHGISGRARLFEAVQQVNIVNAQRKARLRGKEFTGSSYDDTELQKNPSLAVDYKAVACHKSSPFCVVKVRSHFATDLSVAAVSAASADGTADENCGDNFLCIIAAVSADKL